MPVRYGLRDSSKAGNPLLPPPPKKKKKKNVKLRQPCAGSICHIHHFSVLETIGGLQMQVLNLQTYAK